MKRLTINFKSDFEDHLTPSQQEDIAFGVVDRFNKGEEALNTISNSMFFARTINNFILYAVLKEKRGEENASKYMAKYMKDGVDLSLDYRLVDVFEDGKPVKVDQTGFSIEYLDNITEKQVSNMEALFDAIEYGLPDED
jgi:hypothetical protein